MHPYSSAVLRELHLHKEHVLRHAEFAKQMEFDRQVAPAETAVTQNRLATVFGRLTGRLHDRLRRTPRSLAPGNF